MRCDPPAKRGDLDAELLRALGGSRLERQRAQPLCDLRLHVAGALDLRRHARELQLGPVPPPLEAPQTGRLLDQHPPFLRLACQDRLDAALRDDRAHRLAEADLREQLDDVRAPDLRAVDEVLALSAAVQPANDRDLREIELGQRTVLVVEQQLDLAVVGRGPVRGPGEEHVVRLLGAELAGRERTGRPDQRVGDVRLARTVRPDDDGDARLEPDLDRVGERLEAAQLDCTQVHARGRLTIEADGPARLAPRATRPRSPRAPPGPPPARRPSSCGRRLRPSACPRSAPRT